MLPQTTTFLEYTMKSQDDMGLIGGCDFYLGDGWQGNFEVYVQESWGMRAATRKGLYAKPVPEKMRASKIQTACHQNSTL